MWWNCKTFWSAGCCCVKSRWEKKAASLSFPAILLYICFLHICNDSLIWIKAKRNQRETGRVACRKWNCVFDTRFTSIVRETISVPIKSKTVVLGRTKWSFLSGSSCLSKMQRLFLSCPWSDHEKSVKLNIQFSFGLKGYFMRVSLPLQTLQHQSLFA